MSCPNFCIPQTPRSIVGVSFSLLNEQHQDFTPSMTQAYKETTTHLDLLFQCSSAAPKQKKKNIILFNKNSLLPFISDPLIRGPYSSQRSPFGCKVISTIKSENKRSKRRWNPNKTPKIQRVESKVNLGVEPGKATSGQHRNSQVTSQGLQYIYII